MSGLVLRLVGRPTPMTRIGNLATAGANVYAHGMSHPDHAPVLVAEVLEHLHLRPDASCIDATVNGGGHAAAILQATAPTGRVLGIDRDPELLMALRARLGGEIESGRLQLASGNFSELSRIVAARHFGPADGILFDLGLSSFHLEESGRGFTFAHDEPLDMRFDPTDEDRETAAAIVATRDADELTVIFRSYGEERFASRIARTIVARRRETPVETSGQLFSLIEQALPPTTRWRVKRHAARIFQALRIATNDELDAVAQALPQALAALAPQGRLLVISFHSLEDRLTKNFLRDQQQAGRVRILTKKPIQPAAEEISANPRAASAKLRAAQRT